MKTRLEWTRKEWVVYLLCMLGATAAIVLAFVSAFKGHPELILLLLGVAAVLQGMAWSSELLLAPRLPLLGPGAEDPVEIRRFGATMLVHGAYILLLGLVFYVLVK
jgi:hypothetical protein